MKNKEKYAKEILDTVCKGNAIAIDKTTKKLNYCEETNCDECYFLEDNYPYNTGSCAENFIHWANAEYKEKKEFSEADKAYVKAMDKLNWFARDEDGNVWGFVNKPFKKYCYWHADSTGFVLLKSFASSATFEPLNWDDDEPTHRDEILGNKETEKYTEILKVKETRKYTEILRLKEMLEKANIPFTFTDDFFGAKKRGILEENSYPAYQIRLNKNIDVIQHFGSYGEDENLLEIKGGLTVEESKESSVLGYLTAEEVFKRFKYCYENGTMFYKGDQK